MWNGIHGHDDVVDRFRTALKNDRVAGTYLFIGPDGIGKRTVAIQLAKSILCLNAGAEDPLAACGTCASCLLIRDGDNVGAHPDLEMVGKLPDKQLLTIAVMIGEDETRNKAGLMPRMAIKPAIASRKIAIIDDADLINKESANVLLKPLEEPSSGALFFLIATSQKKQLPTIRSRSQIVRFQPLPVQSIADLLLGEGIVDDRERALAIAAASRGRLAAARLLADDWQWAFRSRFLKWISGQELDAPGMTRAVATFIEGDPSKVTKKNPKNDAKEQRRQLRRIIDFAIEYYRGLLRTDCAVDVDGDAEFRAAIERTPPIVEPERHLRRLDYCLDAHDFIGKNANMATLIDWWIDSLAAA